MIAAKWNGPIMGPPGAGAQADGARMATGPGHQEMTAQRRYRCAKRGAQPPAGGGEWTLVPWLDPPRTAETSNSGFAARRRLEMNLAFEDDAPATRQSCGVRFGRTARQV